MRRKKSEQQKQYAKEWKAFGRAIKKKGGLSRMFLITHDDASFIAALFAADYRALMFMTAIRAALAEIAGKLCLCCEYRFVQDGAQPAGFIILTAGALDESPNFGDVTLVSPICQNCHRAQSHDDLFGRCLKVLLEQFPGFKAVNSHAEPDRMM
jgi:hypothetical protein